MIGCGPGFDVAILDFADAIDGATAAEPDGDCERVRRHAPRPGDARRDGDGQDQRGACFPDGRGSSTDMYIGIGTLIIIIILLIILL